MFESYDEGYEDGEKKGKAIGLAIGREEAARVVLDLFNGNGGLLDLADADDWRGNAFNTAHWIMKSIEDALKEAGFEVDPTSEETKAWCSQNEDS